MKRILFFDTETTGKILFREPFTHPAQPRMIQLAAMLTDETGSPMSYLAVLIKPDGWNIPAEATAIHGITDETCEQFGMSIQCAMDAFRCLAASADRIVAHNIDFDKVVVRSENHRGGGDAKWLDESALYCTMKAATPVCKIPGRYGDFKWPSLAETYAHFFDKPLEKAHDAMADLIACKDCYFALEKPADQTAVEAESLFGSKS